VIETHFHADFVSGHLELADRTGATIWYGEGAEADFPIGVLADGERIALGDVELEVRATPGHTPESICLVVHERAGDEIPYGVLTGDTLFIGDVGRPDLLSAVGVTAHDLAAQLYRSIHDQLLPLPDETRVYPAHGAGSACGRSLSTETWSTLGEQRRTNYALAPMTEAEFVAAVTEGQPAAPAYFPFSAHRNHERHPLLHEHDMPEPLGLSEVLAVRANGGVVLDARSPSDFAAAHLRGAVNVGLEGRFAEYAGDVITPDQPIAIVADDGHELEVRVRLGRIGFDNVDGALAEPLRVLQDHPELVERSSRLTAGELAQRRDEVCNLVVVDVRNPGEVAATGAIEGAVRIPLPQLVSRTGELDPSAPTVIYCASGRRSLVAASALAAAGFSDVSDLLGGWAAWAGTSADRRREEAVLQGIGEPAYGLDRGRVGTGVEEALVAGVGDLDPVVVGDGDDDATAVVAGERLELVDVALALDPVGDELHLGDAQLQGQLVGPVGGHHRLERGLHDDQQQVDVAQRTDGEVLEARLHVGDHADAGDVLVDLVDEVTHGDMGAPRSA